MPAPVIGTGRKRFVPPKGAVIDRTHPLASSLEVCFVPAYGAVELVRGYTVTKGGSPSAGGTNRFGPSGRFTASTSDYYQIAVPDTRFTGALSLLWAGRNLSASAYRALLTCSNGTARNVPFDWFLSNNASPQDISCNRANATSISGYNVSAAVATNTDYVVVASMPPNLANAGAYCINGVYTSVAGGNGGGSGSVTSGGLALRVGRRNDGATQADGDVAIVAAWSRQLSQAEMQELNADPFCFLRY